MYNSSIYPIKINQYTPKQKPVQSDERNGSNSSEKQEQKEPNYNTIYKPTPGYYGKSFSQYSVQPKPQSQQQIQQHPQNNYPQTSENTTSMTRQAFPNGEKTAIDYTQSKINISQVIKDFKNTTEAIGSPDDVKETVYTYVSLVQKEAEKENPNKKIIQSNLKNASQVLDEYITDTLKKPSKVVEGWIDSLFLQNVDYKYDESVINPDYLVNLPQKNRAKVDTQEKTQTTKQQLSQQTEVQKKSDNPFFDTLISAKKEKNPAEALNIYSSVIEDATAQNDTLAASVAYFESGKLYDNFNSFDKALENYQNAIAISDNDGLKAQAYMKMALIQHDTSKLKDAGENYFSSIAYFGQVENPKAQAVLLSQTGKLAGEEFDSKNAADFFYVANSLAQDLDDSSLKGKINQKAGETFSYLNEPQKALGYYRDSAASYDEIQNNQELAKDYQAAAKLMYELGNPAKARTLLNKAFKASVKADNYNLTQSIQAQIAALG
ncbi:hypothetical protein IJS77_05570 [bacterium]|nr:hypothetical protein [bacterium]